MDGWLLLSCGDVDGDVDGDVVGDVVGDVWVY